MNLNQITSGTDYAFFPSRGRGEDFRWCGRPNNSNWNDNGNYGDKSCVYRVKAMRAFSQKEPGKTRETGYVDVFWLTDDGEFKLDDPEDETSYITKTVRVRDLATFWEDYEDTRDYEQAKRDKEEAVRKERRKEQQEHYEKIEAERTRIREERLEQERVERERLENERKMYIRTIEQGYNLPAGSVSMNGSGMIFLNKEIIDNDIRRKVQVHFHGT